MTISAGTVWIALKKRLRVWAREKLYQLFNYRYNARLPTVITTAVPIEQLDPRLASRMLDGIRCTFFVLEAPSYRGKNTRPKRAAQRRN